MRQDPIAAFEQDLRERSRRYALKRAEAACGMSQANGSIGLSVIPAPDGPIRTLPDLLAAAPARAQTDAPLSTPIRLGADPWRSKLS